MGHPALDVRETAYVIQPPPTTNVTIVENCRLARRDCPLGLVEGDQYFAVVDWLDGGCRRLVAMANLDDNPHGLAQIIDRNQVHSAGAEGARVQMLVAADDDLLARRRLIWMT